MKPVQVYDDRVVIFGQNVSNCIVCAILCFLNLIITSVSLAQQVFSIVRYGHVFLCNFNESHAVEPFLSYDIVIYDFGLFHRLWGISECIANYLDGGYLRLAWCVSYLSTMLLLALYLYISDKRPPVYLMWPALAMQSTYSIGLLILTLSALPKLLRYVFVNIDRTVILLLTIFSSGILINFIFTYILWHYFWFSEATLAQSCTKNLNTNNVNTSDCLLFCPECLLPNAKETDHMNTAVRKRNRTSATGASSTSDSRGIDEASTFQSTSTSRYHGRNRIKHQYVPACCACEDDLIKEGMKGRCMSVLRCGHVFCYACITPVLQSKRKKFCPTCNIRFFPSTVTNVKP
ncbi:zinc finger, C3HC4 type [Trichinella nativa]|uniref:Zinc finger, C3HC4 type n=1 Tax=Trichinella nativa TaxID=6335 RepID=A0A1Y3F0H8_9BILA|nr:zinc finger, C3HC4 type [Trichinella nativa]